MRLSRLFIATLFAAFSHPADALEPVKIRAGWVSTPASLIPLIFAKPGPGRGVDIIMRAALRTHGLEDKRDYTVIEAPFPTQKAVLKDRKADLTVPALPFSYDPEVLDMAKTLFDSRSGFGTVALSF